MGNPLNATEEQVSTEASSSEAVLSDGSTDLPGAQKDAEANQEGETPENQEEGAAQDGESGSERIQDTRCPQAEDESKQIESVNISAANETGGNNDRVLTTLDEAIMVDRIHEIFRLSHQVCSGSKVVSALELFNIEKISADGVEYILNGMDSTGDRLIDLDDFLHVDVKGRGYNTTQNSSANTTDDAKTENSTHVDEGVSSDSDEGKDTSDESLPSDDAAVLEVPTTSMLSESSSFIAAGYLASLVYICLAGCTCMSAATCMRQTTVLFWVAAISLSMLLIKTQVSFCG